MSEQFSPEWMEEYRQIVNDDKPLKVIGKHGAFRFLLGIGDREYLFVFNKGRLEPITLSGALDFDANWAFAIRGPRDAFEKFVMRYPPPIYTDVVFMSFNQRIKIEGNLLVFWQNVRALLWTMELMRKVDAPAVAASG